MRYLFNECEAGAGEEKEQGMDGEGITHGTVSKGMTVIFSRWEC